jgi:hypothetical protein
LSYIQEQQFSKPHYIFKGVRESLVNLKELVGIVSAWTLRIRKKQAATTRIMRGVNLSG